jgi:hypothetical protein
MYGTVATLLHCFASNPAVAKSCENVVAGDGWADHFTLLIKALLTLPCNLAYEIDHVNVFMVLLGKNYHDREDFVAPRCCGAWFADWQSALRIQIFI